MESLLAHYILFWRPLGYSLVFLGMIFEGDILLFTVSFLTHQGFFDVGDMFFTILGGVLVGDLFWYWVGFRFHKHPIFLNKWVHRVAQPFDSHLTHRTFRTILLSKFAYGIHHGILMRAGALKVNITRFVKDDFTSTLVWIFAVGGLGYISSASFAAVKHYLRFTEFALLLALFMFVGIEYLSRRISKGKL
ncbi:MAG: VTT domain-containing protein [Candidatus Portnoybacteria bacterium]|nr:VTT domain-containing protein [Candidatus Portnoybacteria bacterium]